MKVVYQTYTTHTSTHWVLCNDGGNRGTDGQILMEGAQKREQECEKEQEEEREEQRVHAIRLS